MEQNNATTEAPTPTDDVSELDNVGPKRAKQLHEKGLETIADVADIEWQFPSDVAEGFEGVKIHNQAKDIVDNHTEDDESDNTEDELTTEEKRENINERIDELTDLINTAVEHGFDKQAHNLLDEKLECYDLLDELNDEDDTDDMEEAVDDVMAAFDEPDEISEGMELTEDGETVYLIKSIRGNDATVAIWNDGRRKRKQRMSADELQSDYENGDLVVA